MRYRASKALGPGGDISFGDGVDEVLHVLRLIVVEVALQALLNDGRVPDVVQVIIVTEERASDVVATAIGRERHVQRLMNVTEERKL
jgi:hypothetical protein